MQEEVTQRTVALWVEATKLSAGMLQQAIPTPTFYMKDRGRGTCKNKALNEDNRYKWNKATLTHILTRQEYCGDVVNFKTTKHFRDKRNHYVDRSQWQITENVHEPIIDRADFETAQRILENAPVRRPNGDGEIHPLSGLLFCKDCGAKMHIRIDYRNGGKRHVAYCSEYHKGKAKNPKCHSPHIIDADLLMQTVAEVLKKIEDYSISNRAEFEALVKKNLAMQQTDQTKKQQKRIPQITTRLEQIDKVLNKYFDNIAVYEAEKDWLSVRFPIPLQVVKNNLTRLPCNFPRDFDINAYQIFQGMPQRILQDGHFLNLGGREIQVIHTPGHSPGHCCFYEPERNYLYSGDLIYKGSLDAFYPTTDPQLFYQSIRRIQKYKIKKVLPGHHQLDIPVSLIGDIEAGFAHLSRAGKLKQGNGLFEFRDFQIHI